MLNTERVPQELTDSPYIYRTWIIIFFENLIAMASNILGNFSKPLIHYRLWSNNKEYEIGFGISRLRNKFLAGLNRSVISSQKTISACGPECTNWCQISWDLFGIRWWYFFDKSYLLRIFCVSINRNSFAFTYQIDEFFTTLGSGNYRSILIFFRYSVGLGLITYFRLVKQDYKDPAHSLCSIFYKV